MGSSNTEAAPGERTGLLPTTGADTTNADTTASRPILRHLSQSWESYNETLEKRPLLVKSITAFFILGLGDMCAQGMEHATGVAASTGVDWPRAARFGLFGLLGAPWSHYYFYYLDYYLPPTEDPWTWTTAIKLVIDQALQAPLLLAFIICALALMKGGGIAGARDDLQENYVDTLIANCTFRISGNCPPWWQLSQLTQ